MRKFSFLAGLLLVATFFIGCDQKINTGAADVKYDREICERCKMIISDRHHTVQAINPANGKRYYYDDIGCMVLWFDEQKLDWFDQAIIYVTDFDTGVWIDARTAPWSNERITPMSFGMVAHKDKSDIDLIEHREIIGFDEVIKAVRERGK